MKTAFALLTLASTLACSTWTPTALAADTERIEHKTLPATGGGTLTFKTCAGAIDITTHTNDQVVYDAVLKPGNRWFGPKAAELLDLLQFDYETEGGSVKITMKWKEGQQPRSVSMNARHTLWVPANYHLDVRTAGGGISAEDIHGQVTAQTAGGSLQFKKIAGNLKARTSGGGIELNDIKGDADVETSGGGIHVSGVDGNLSLHTSGGGIHVGAVKGTVKGRTSGGGIHVELDAQIEKPMELSTSGGTIRLIVPGGFKADVDASTSGGRVDCELPVQGRIKRNSIEGSLNDGGPLVKLHTSGGNIHITKK